MGCNVRERHTHGAFDEPSETGRRAVHGAVVVVPGRLGPSQRVDVLRRAVGCRAVSSLEQAGVFRRKRSKRSVYRYNFSRVT